MRIAQLGLYALVAASASACGGVALEGGGSHDGGDGTGDASTERSEGGDSGKPDACTPGAACTPKNRCDLGATDCTTGACVDTGNANAHANGVSCGDHVVCEEGSCVACAKGSACTPASNACHTGTLDCSTPSGVPGCIDTGTRAKDETPCETYEACCAGSCSDEQTDPDNCGRCGHSCVGGACVAGVCQPVALAEDEGVAIAVDSTSVYWISAWSGSVDKAPIAGGAVTTLAAGSPYAYGIAVAVDATSVYSVNGGVSIVSIPIAGGAPTTLATSTSTVSDLAIDSSYVYWANSTSKRQNGGLFRAAKSGGTPQTLASEAAFTGQVVVAAGEVYWGISTGIAGAILSVPVGGGTAITVAAFEPTCLAAGPSDLYWSGPTSPSGIYDIPLGGGPSTPFVSGGYLEPTGAMTADTTHLYWIGRTTNTSTIYGMPLSGGTPITVTSVEGLIAIETEQNAIAVDATSVYFLGSTAVMRVAKP
jgi:hypothetical protein